MRCGLPTGKFMKRCPVGFSSIGLPEARIDEVFAVATAFQCDFVEMRVMRDDNALGEYLDEYGKTPVEVRILGTSFRLSDAGPGDLDEFSRVVDLAGRCGARFLRVFFGGAWSPEPITDEKFQEAARTLRRCREIIAEKGAKTDILLETHSSCSSSRRCQRLMEIAGEAIPILWDSHHTWRAAGEDPAESWKILGEVIAHVHCKDSSIDRNAEAGCRYVLPGEGEFPFSRLFSILERAKFVGGVSLEWEKMWHPELTSFPEPLEDFLRLLKRFSVSK